MACVGLGGSGWENRYLWFTRFPTSTIWLLVNPHCVYLTLMNCTLIPTMYGNVSLWIWWLGLMSYICWYNPTGSVASIFVFSYYDNRQHFLISLIFSFKLVWIGLISLFWLDPFIWQKFLWWSHHPFDVYIWWNEGAYLIGSMKFWAGFFYNPWVRYPPYPLYFLNLTDDVSIIPVWNCISFLYLLVLVLCVWTFSLEYMIPLTQI